ncbi:hypothetical protein CYMTET_33892, partial [Cymbomonas tetramitiformis]
GWQGKGDGKLITVDVPSGYVADTTMFLAVQCGDVEDDRLRIAGSKETNNPTEKDGYFNYRYQLRNRSDAGKMIMNVTL